MDVGSRLLVIFHKNEHQKLLETKRKKWMPFFAPILLYSGYCFVC